MFVVWYETHYQDGREDHSRIFQTVEKALEWIENMENVTIFSTKDRTEYRMFRVGEEVPIEFGEEKVEEVKTVTRKTVHLKKGK